MCCRDKSDPLQASPPTCKKVKLENDDATAAAVKPSAPSSIPCVHSAASVSISKFLFWHHSTSIINDSSFYTFLFVLSCEKS